MSRLHALHLTQFRSYEQLDLKLNGQSLILTGENGAGKTNLLEAISLLSPGRGLRRAKLANLTHIPPEFLKHDQPNPLHKSGWAISAKVKSSPEASLSVIGTGQLADNASRRTVRIDGSAVSANHLSEHLSLMWLTPAQDRLFTGPASDRRAFIDRFCLSHFPGHAMASLRYERARRERGRLLSDQIADDLWYEALEDDMAKFGAQIAAARAAMIHKLEKAISSHMDNAFPKARISLDGEAEELAFSGANEDDLSQFISGILRQNRGTDMRARRTLRGIHKTDLNVYHLTKSMPAAQCSTGEQKALLIGLILAQAQTISQSSPRPPILLLDEIVAHLDPIRRDALASELSNLGHQTIMTGTDADLFRSFDRFATLREVANGQIL